MYKKEIQKYLQNNNATIKFTNDGKIEVTYDYGELGTVELYNSFEDMFDYIKWDIYKQTLKLQVEISGRQTGKTNRLIEAMSDHIKNEGICFLYCMNQDIGRLIVSKLEELTGGSWVKSYIHINPHSGDIAEIKSHDLMGVRYFFDEFDFLKEYHQIYMPNGYYCTTPRFLRNKNISFGYNNDLLLTLINRCNFNFEHRINHKLFKEYCGEINDKQLRIESGEIFK